MPVRLIGKRVRVVLHASHLVVYDQNVEVARHERLIAKGGCRLELDHYLEASHSPLGLRSWNSHSDRSTNAPITLAFRPARFDLPLRDQEKIPGPTRRHGPG
ncbi:hypothetical protein [Streptomyces sp. TRM70350]|uniref:Mu transposase domain-containing protein n=1 Tax=Streptomyces sp. TRM70350 TaxID=2856165 RepID=UPI0035A8AE98